MRWSLPVLAVALLVAAAWGDAKSDNALKAAVAKGKDLWSKPWSEGSKTCAACHVGGPNKMTASRLKSYPKYNKQVDKVISSQQMLNLMIANQAKGTALELGADDLNALEAFIGTLK